MKKTSLRIIQLLVLLIIVSSCSKAFYKVSKAFHIENSSKDEVVIHCIIKKDTSIYHLLPKTSAELFKYKGEEYLMDVLNKKIDYLSVKKNGTDSTSTILIDKLNGIQITKSFKVLTPEVTKGQVRLLGSSYSRKKDTYMVIE